MKKNNRLKIQTSKGETIMTTTNTTAIQNFVFNTATIRVLADEQGEPWFVAKDVAEAL